MDSNSLPLVPDLDVFPRPVRKLLLAVLVLGPLCFFVLVLAGAGSSPTVVVEGKAVESAPQNAAVYPLSRFPDDSPVRVAVREAVRDGSGSVETTTDAARYDGVPHSGYYVRHDGRIVEVSVSQQ
jgi:hypothetical protein